MSIYMIGIDHNKAALDVRSLFSFTKKNMKDFMEKMSLENKINGIIILSTCNRMEIWVSGENILAEVLYEQLCDFKEIDGRKYKDLWKKRENDEAISHLFHLACGLKSQILGEDQIVTQVGNALELSREFGYTDSVLEVLFRKAVTAAKQVKTEVVFPHGNVSVIANAITKLQESGLQIKDKKCVVIGNGEMGKVAAQTFLDAGAKVCVTVRQYQHGIVEVPKGCEPIDYTKRLEYIKDCDYVVSATTSPHYTITKEQIEEINNQSKLIMIDLAVPRDIERTVKKLSKVSLFDIDDFKDAGENEQLTRAKEQAEKILETLMKEFYDWNQSHAIIPRIQFIKEESVKDLELRLTKQLKNLELEEKEKKQLIDEIDKATEKVINKIIFGLKDHLEQETFLECIKGLEQIYEE